MEPNECYIQGHTISFGDHITRHCLWIELNLDQCERDVVVHTYYTRVMFSEKNSSFMAGILIQSPFITKKLMCLI